MVKIAFLENKLTIRGTSTAMYDYAHYNEKILGNISIIITRRPQDSTSTTRQTYNKFAKRFPMVYYTFSEEIDDIVVRHGIDILYVIKSGRRDDKLYTSKCKCVIHCVFDLTDRHGDVYATISESVNKIHRTSYPVVPHLITVDTTNEDLRGELFIHPEAIVYGYYGGNDSFDIPFVRETVKSLASEKIVFLFMNMDKFYDNEHVIFLEGTNDPKYKRMFINTCDAMIHARNRGETFGIVCGEFSYCGKPVITYGKSSEDNHITILGNKAILYNDKYELQHILINFQQYDEVHNNHISGYVQYASPEYVMGVFKRVFID